VFTKIALLFSSMHQSCAEEKSLPPTPTAMECHDILCTKVMYQI